MKCPKCQENLRPEEAEYMKANNLVICCKCREKVEKNAGSNKK